MTGFGNFNAFTPLDVVLLVIRLAVALLEIFAIIDAATRIPAAFVAADKLTKPAWLGILVGTLLIGFVIGFLVLAGLVAAIVYIVDVRPAVREIGRGGSNMGPYGPW